MFGIFKKKKQEIKKSEGKEYSFIWYKQMKVRDKVFYTQPFRTKVRAKNYKEAKEKATNFALGKMELVVVREKDFDKTKLSKLEKGFANMHKQMDELFKGFN